jgi:hypothetical protein
VNLLHRLLSASTDNRALHWCPRCRAGVQPSLLRRRSCRCGWRIDSPDEAAIRTGQLDTGLRQERRFPAAQQGRPLPALLETEVYPIAARSWRATEPLFPPAQLEPDAAALGR